MTDFRRYYNNMYTYTVVTSQVQNVNGYFRWKCLYVESKEETGVQTCAHAAFYRRGAANKI